MILWFKLRRKLRRIIIGCIICQQGVLQIFYTCICLKMIDSLRNIHNLIYSGDWIICMNALGLTNDIYLIYLTCFLAFVWIFLIWTTLVWDCFLRKFCINNSVVGRLLEIVVNCHSVHLFKIQSILIHQGHLRRHMDLINHVRQIKLHWNYFLFWWQSKWLLIHYLLHFLYTIFLLNQRFLLF